MARLTVGPKKGGGWQVSGGDESGDFKTQRDAIAAGKGALEELGGGRLVVKGRNGKVRMRTTYGRPDRRSSRGNSKTRISHAPASKPLPVSRRSRTGSTITAGPAPPLTAPGHRKG
jgi:hypothetical protein